MTEKLNFIYLETIYLDPFLSLSSQFSTRNLTHEMDKMVENRKEELRKYELLLIT
jgi:hypothetical protein